MSEAFQSIGIIAGSRELPLVFARQARAMGVRRIVAAAFEGETDPALAALVDDIEWLRVGQLSRMIETFTRRGVTHCVMAGQIAPRNLFDLRPDLRAMAMLLKLREKNAHTIFGAIIEEMRKDGVDVVPAIPWLKPLMPGAGFRIGPKPTDVQREDIAFGLRLAREMSRLDIGQTVVVKDGTVLAVEGFEGTDRCLARGGELAGKAGGAVAVKLAKPDHDMRFDIPCIGALTIETCAKSGVTVLAVEPGRTLLLEQERCEQLAHAGGVTVVTTD